MKVIYTEEQKKHAIQTFKKYKSYSKTIRVLGYPSRHVLFDWVKNVNKPGRPPKKPIHPPRKYSFELKHKAVILALHGMCVKEVAKELDLTTHAIIYDWLRNYRLYAKEGLMSKKEKIDKGIYKTKAQLVKSLPDNVSELKELTAKLMVEKAVLEQELELSKKLEGGVPDKLPNTIKVQIILTLLITFPLGLLLEVLQIKRSSFYYVKHSFEAKDKYAHIRVYIHEIAKENHFTYGSPRIWMCLKKKGITVSEKVVRRLMKEESIEVRYAKRKRPYSSYIGEVTPACENIVERNFHADTPNKLWLTDITEFASKESKLYLSPMIDCFDGMIVSYSLSKHPDQFLVDAMLEDALVTLDNIEDCKELIIHTDRGGHYRGGRWIERLEGLGITRSMSRKGNSGDNIACEGFFGRMKTEMYYPLTWDTTEELIQAIHTYIDFYNNKSIKVELKGRTIQEHRAMITQNV